MEGFVCLFFTGFFCVCLIFICLFRFGWLGLVWFDLGSGSYAVGKGLGEGEG